VTPIDFVRIYGIELASSIEIINSLDWKEKK